MRLIVTILFLSVSLQAQKIVVYKGSSGEILYKDGASSDNSLMGEANLGAFKTLEVITSSTIWTDYVQTGIEDIGGWKYEGTSNLTINSITRPAEDQTFLFFNNTDKQVKFNHNGSGTAFNTFLCPGGGLFTLDSYGSVEIMYIYSIGQWIIKMPFK